MSAKTKHKILIIDDDHDDLEIMRDVYENHERTEHSMISGARNMINYLDQITEDSNLPKVIITDYFLPGITGAEVLRNLKGHHRYREIDVIVYSSSYIDSLVIICEELGARIFLKKPATIPEYEAMMETVLNIIEEKTARPSPSLPE